MEDTWLYIRRDLINNDSINGPITGGVDEQDETTFLQ